MVRHYDKETEIETYYYFWIEGIQVKINDRWCPGASITLYQRDNWARGGRTLLYTAVDCAEELPWTPAGATPLYLGEGLEIEYWGDEYVHYEMLATKGEADEIATRVTYDAQHEAHIKITHSLSIGTSTVWLKVTRHRQYMSFFHIDVSFCVEFANSEDCTRFLHEDMTKLEYREVYDDDSDVGVINDIMRALSPLRDDHFSAEVNAVRRGIPYSQFVDGYPQPETQIIRRRGSNRGDDRPCFLKLHLSIWALSQISGVDWSATTIPPTFPSPSSAFQSLNNVHLKFPSHASQHRNSSHQGDLTITISARQISFSTDTDSVSLGNGFTVSSEHRTVTVNYINAIMGDAFLGPISRSNVGGTNNVNNNSAHQALLGLVRLV